MKSNADTTRVWPRDGTLLKLWPFSLVKDTEYGITALDIAKGMVQGSLFDIGSGGTKTRKKVQ
jgi:hypothetical protein